MSDERLTPTRYESVGCDGGRFTSPTFRSLAEGKSKGVFTFSD